MIAVYKRELVGLFRNPVAYVILGMYAFVSSLFFITDVLLNATSFLGAYFGTLSLLEIVVVSILSMRFFSEEKKNKTDQLLMTAPVSLNGVVMGKFLGGMTLYFACTMINLVYVLVVDIFGSPDPGVVFTNFLGTLLLGALMVSVSLFISSLTESGIAAAGGTAAVFFLFYLIKVVIAFLDWLPSWLSWLPDALSELNIFLWLANFQVGILSLKSVVYYISLTAVFLFLSVRVLERRRWR